MKITKYSYTQQYDDSSGHNVEQKKQIWVNLHLMVARLLCSCENLLSLGYDGALFCMYIIVQYVFNSTPCDSIC